MPLKRARLSSDWMPQIPKDRQSSLISLEQRHERITKSIDPHASAEEYVEKQEELLAITDEHARMCSTGLVHGRNNGDISQEQYETAMAQINLHRRETGLEQNTSDGRTLTGYNSNLSTTSALRVGICISSTVSRICTGSEKESPHGQHCWKVFGVMFGPHQEHIFDEACCYH